MGKTIPNVFVHVFKNGYEYETSPFGPRKDPINGKDSFHNGEDIISSKYSTDYIIAFEGGVVEALRNTISGFDKANSSGNYIYIKHKGGYQTRYLHLKKDSLAVEVGQAVGKGDVIAYMGTTGYSTGNHLHFEVRLDGEPQDPIPYLNGSKAIPAEAPIPASTPSDEYKIGDIIDFKGGYHYSNAQAYTPTGSERSAGKAKITGLAQGINIHITLLVKKMALTYTDGLTLIRLFPLRTTKYPLRSKRTMSLRSKPEQGGMEGSLSLHG